MLRNRRHFVTGDGAGTSTVAMNGPWEAIDGIGESRQAQQLAAERVLLPFDRGGCEQKYRPS